MDEKSKTVLLKRLKGKNFETDKNNLMKYTNLDEKAASDIAYLVAEAAAWESFIQILAVNGDCSDKKIAEVLKFIDNAVTVEETPKITITDLS